MTEATVRRLNLGEEDTLRTIRLEALSDDPDAFGSTYEREVDRTAEDWLRWFTGGAVFVAQDAKAAPVGIAAAYRDVGGAPVIYLVSMWVSPSHRGTGIADELVRAVLAWAESAGAESVRLNVVGGNIRASKLYERHGFYPTGNTVMRERDGAVEVEMQRD
jgi:ribosomal protein S18 acetylase RimI-like enzyme